MVLGGAGRFVCARRRRGSSPELPCATRSRPNQEDFFELRQLVQNVELWSKMSSGDNCESVANRNSIANRKFLFAPCFLPHNSEKAHVCRVREIWSDSSGTRERRRKPRCCTLMYHHSLFSAGFLPDPSGARRCGTARRARRHLACALRFEADDAQIKMIM